MRIELENRELGCFVWDGPLLKDLENGYLEHFVNNDYLCEFDRFGETYVDCLWARSLFYPPKLSPCEENNEAVLNIFKFLTFEYQKNKDRVTDVFYEALKRLAESIYDNAYYCLMHHKTRPSEVAQELYKSICRYVGAEFDNAFHPEICLQYLKASLYVVNNLCRRSYEAIDIDIIKDLSAELHAHERASRLCRDCLTDREKRKKEDNPRCVAVYAFNEVFDTEPKTKGYLVFSGFLDCEDEAIRQAFSLNDDNNTLIEVVKNIAQRLDLTLVQPCMDIGLYGIENNAISRITLLGTELKKANKSGFDKAAYDKLKKDFSCCERKIFTKFFDGYRPGILFVKFDPCEKCQLGILYEQKEGHVFALVPKIKL